MDYDPETKTLHIRMMDAEHAGFDWEALQFEMGLYGLDESILLDTIVIDVKTGCAVVVNKSE